MGSSVAKPGRHNLVKMGREKREKKKNKQSDFSSYKTCLVNQYLPSIIAGINNTIVKKAKVLISRAPGGRQITKL